VAGWLLIFLLSLASAKPQLPKLQGCLNGRPMVKFTVRTSARVRVYPADEFLPSAPTLNTTSVRMRQQIHAGAGPRGSKSAWIRRCADVSARARVPADAQGHASCGHWSAETLGRVHGDAALGGGRYGFAYKRESSPPFSLTSNQS
jgi:hypothetical protein